MSELKQIAGYRVISDDQKITIRITPKSNQTLLKASMLGSTIRNFGRLMLACADESGLDCEAFITGLSMHEDGTVEVSMSILPLIKDEEQTR